MQGLRLFVKRYEMVIFVVVAYLLSWWPMIWSFGLLPHGPLLAALLVLWVGEGGEGVKRWWVRLFQRAAWWWYAVAAVFPIAIPFAAAGLNLWMGAQVQGEIDWSVPFQVLPVLLLMSGMWEEPGWTGFSLVRLLERFGFTAVGILRATLVMAGIRTFWHLPLMFSGAIYWTDILMLVAVQIVISWLYIASAPDGVAVRNEAPGFSSGFSGQGVMVGSVLVVMWMHLLNNTISGEFVQWWFSGADWIRHYWLVALLWCVAAGVILWVTRGNFGRKTEMDGQRASVGQVSVP